jgi:hypothetical protein
MDFGIRGRVARIRGEEFLERRSNCKDLGNPGSGVIELEMF